MKDKLIDKMKKIKGEEMKKKKEKEKAPMKKKKMGSSPSTY